MPGWAKEVLVQPFDWHDADDKCPLGAWETPKVPLLERGVMSDCHLYVYHCMLPLENICFYLHIQEQTCKVLIIFFLSFYCVFKLFF